MIFRFCPPVFSIVVFTWFCAPAAFAQTATLVKDVNAVPNLSANSNAAGFAELDGLVYFFASTNVRNLWRTDGTPEGTTIVKSGLSGWRLTEFSGALYFAGADEASGFELWRTDGTEAGTVRVKDINPGDGDSLSTVEALVEFDGALFFRANDGVHGLEIWKSDGTEAGTAMVKDIAPDPGEFLGSIIAFNDALYFSASDGVNGQELWRTDGTPQGTAIVRDINPGAGSSHVSGLTDIGGALLFGADDGTHGHELWRSNGTTGGTSLVEDIQPGPAGSVPGAVGSLEFENVDGTVYFGADDGSGAALWKSNGTPGGTTLVLPDIYPVALTDLDGTLFFFEAELFGSRPADAKALWTSEGTPASTEMVQAFEHIAYNQRPLSFDGSFFFSANDGVTGQELWRSDGTTAGTVLVKDIGADGSAFPGELTAVGETIYFTAYSDSIGSELWKTNGTEQGTTLVKNIGVLPGDSDPWELTLVGDYVFFTAVDGVNGRELWKTDGTEDGTYRVRDIHSSTTSMNWPYNLISVNDTLLFVATDDVNGHELWTSDGSEEGTVMVKDINAGEGAHSSPAFLTDLNGSLFFSANDGIRGRELWRSDGTEEGTVLVKDINPDGQSSDPGSPAAVNGMLFFIANDGNGRELWRSDGTEAGTVMVKDIYATGADIEFHSLTAVGDLLFFRTFDTTENHRIWRSDGTEAGTMVLESFVMPPFFSNFADVDGTLFFGADRILWKSDGTPEGTVEIKDVGFALERFSVGSQFTSYHHALYFLREDPEDGIKLWRSDGTELGTNIVDSLPEEVLEVSRILDAHAGSLFLNAKTNSGAGILRLRGAPDDTTVATGSFLAEIAHLAGLGSQVVFVGSTADEGNELWSMPLMPAISSAGVVDAAGFEPTLAPGSLASLFGVELTGGTAAAQSFPLPTSLAGTSIQVNGVDAPLVFASPMQINFQVPYGTPTGGAVSVVARLNGQASPSEPTAVAEFAPALFVNPATDEPIVQRHADGALITAQNPAKPGDILILYVTGIGALDNSPVTGEAAAVSPLSTATALPTVAVGGVEVAVTFAGLTPNFAGLGQINIELPDELPQGGPLPLVISFGDAESPTVELHL